MIMNTTGENKLKEMDILLLKLDPIFLPEQGEGWSCLSQEDQVEESFYKEFHTCNCIN
jgi:hypothetical protein